MKIIIIYCQIIVITFEVMCELGPTAPSVRILYKNIFELILQMHLLYIYITKKCNLSKVGNLTKSSKTLRSKRFIQKRRSTTHLKVAAKMDQKAPDLEDIPFLVRNVPAEIRKEVTELSAKIICHPSYGDP